MACASGGVAVVNGTGKVTRVRTVGKVKALQDALQSSPAHGQIGIAHTRWATHGVPSERNAHPHVSHDGLAIVHNGIIENHDELRAELRARATSSPRRPTPKSSRIASTIHMKTLGDLFKSVRATVAELEGAYALVVLSEKQPDKLDPGAHGLPGGGGAGRRREFRRLGRGRAAAGNAPFHLPG